MVDETVGLQLCKKVHTFVHWVNWKGSKANKALEFTCEVDDSDLFDTKKVDVFEIHGF